MKSEDSCRILVPSITFNFSPPPPWLKFLDLAAVASTFAIYKKTGKFRVGILEAKVSAQTTLNSSQG